MEKKLLFLILLFAITSNSQKKHSLGFSFGVGKNIYSNSKPFDKNNFSFDAPISTSVGVQFVKLLTKKNSAVVQLNYTNKKIKYNYKLNEPNIPYEVNETTIEKYAVISFAIGYRRIINFVKKPAFIEIDLVSDYNIYSSVGNVGTGNGTSNNFLTEPIYYSSFSTNHLGEKSFTFGNNITFGFLLGKKKQYEISANVNIPYNTIQNKTPLYSYQWKYENKTYNHELNYKGKIFYPSIKFTMYVFKK